jgi:hypothetical protein
VSEICVAFRVLNLLKPSSNFPYHQV